MFPFVTIKRYLDKVWYLYTIEISDKLQDNPDFFVEGRWSNEIAFRCKFLSPFNDRLQTLFAIQIFLLLHIYFSGNNYLFTSLKWS